MVDLSEIRDNGPYAARYSSKAALLPELQQILRALSEGYTLREIKGKISKREILTHRSYSNRITIWNHLNRRCFSLGSWVLDAFVKASEDGVDSTDFKSLAYLYYVLRDKLTHAVTTDLIWGFWQEKRVTINAQDILEMINDYAYPYPEIARWKESTKKTISRNLMAALRDFGLLSGVNTKFIQQPTISDEAIFHLLCIQMAEGLKGSQIIESKDWRMFLWDENTVAHNLARLAMLDWIGFEKSGDTVMIELKRQSGEIVE